MQTAIVRVLPPNADLEILTYCLANCKADSENVIYSLEDLGLSSIYHVPVESEFAAYNLAIQHFGSYDFILPIPYTCYFDERGWKSLYKTVLHHPYHGYFAIPTSRNHKKNNEPNVYELEKFGSIVRSVPSVPQLGFTPEHDLLYNEFEGNSLFTRLGIWDLPCAPAERSKFYGNVMLCSYIYQIRNREHLQSLLAS